MNGHSKINLLLNVLFFAIELAGLIYLIMTRKYELTSVIIGNAVFWSLYLFLEAKMGWILPKYIRIMVMLSIFSNGIAGVAFNLYHNPKTPLFDQIQHAFSSYSIAIWMFYIVQQIAGDTITKKFLQFVMILCFALAIGAFYEIMEFAIDQLIQSKTKNQASLYDTDLDMIANLIGGLLASLHFVFSRPLNLYLLYECEKGKQ